MRMRGLRQDRTFARSAGVSLMIARRDTGLKCNVTLLLPTPKRDLERKLIEIKFGGRIPIELQRFHSTGNSLAEAVGVA